MNKINLAVLPSLISRHNTPSRGHALSKIVKNLSNTKPANELIVVVCERKDVFASGCAVARVFPTFSMKTVPGPEDPIATKNVRLRKDKKRQEKTRKDKKRQE